MEKIITQFNKNGYAIISILDLDQLLDIKNMIKERIIDLLKFNSVYKNKINLEEYHKCVSDKNLLVAKTKLITKSNRFCSFTFLAFQLLFHNLLRCLII